MKNLISTFFPIKSSVTFKNEWFIMDRINWNLKNMKLNHLMHLLFCMLTSSSFSQWICEDTLLGNEILKIENPYILTQQGEEYFCGLTEDNDKYDFDYFVRTDDIVFFIAKNKIDSTQIRGFYKKQLFKDYVCWQAYLLWQYYDANSVLIKTEFIDKTDETYEPIPFDVK